MIKKYYPILLSKDGEFKAILHLPHEVKERISPIIEVLPEVFLDGHTARKEQRRVEAEKRRIKEGKPEKPKKERKEKPYENPLEKLLLTHWSFPGNQILLDFTHCNETEPKYIWIFLNALTNGGTNIIPIVSQGSNPVYLDMVMRFANDNDKLVCIRNHYPQSSFANKVVNEGMARFLKVPEADTILLLDVGYIDNDSHKQAIIDTKQALLNITDIGKWRGIIVAAGSFPEDLTDFAARKEPHLLNRHEWRLWNELKTLSISDKLSYADYGIKHPVYSAVGFSGSASIKYSSKDYFVIYRGEKSGDHELGNAQYIMHARELVANTDYYSGEQFSWGDQQISEYSKRNPHTDLSIKVKSKQKPKPGSSGTWVAICQNHHMVLLDEMT